MQLSLFYNTTHEDMAVVRKMRKKSEGQAKRVLKIFQTFRPKKPKTPFDVFSEYCKRHGIIDINSIRRSITDLTSAGYLIKTNKKRKERYGAMNYMWIIKPKINN